MKRVQLYYIFYCSVWYCLLAILGFFDTRVFFSSEPKCGFASPKLNITLHLVHTICAANSDQSEPRYCIIIQSRCKTENQISRVCHTLPVFPRLLLVTWFCFEFWLVDFALCRHCKHQRYCDKSDSGQSLEDYSNQLITTVSLKHIATTIIIFSQRTWYNKSSRIW